MTKALESRDRTNLFKLLKLCPPFGVNRERLGRGHSLPSLPLVLRKVAAMLSSRPSKQFVGALLGCALCFSSTAAGAATTASIPSISPLVTLSAFGTQASASAVCAAGAAAATAAQAPAAGCVLPVVDVAPPPPPPLTPVVTPAYPAAGGEGIGLVPILIGAAVLAGLAAWLLLRDHDDDNEEAVSPD